MRKAILMMICSLFLFISCEGIPVLITKDLANWELRNYELIEDNIEVDGLSLEFSAQFWRDEMPMNIIPNEMSGVVSLREINAVPIKDALTIDSVYLFHPTKDQAWKIYNPPKDPSTVTDSDWYDSTCKVIVNVIDTDWESNITLEAVAVVSLNDSGKKFAVKTSASFYNVY